MAILNKVMQYVQGKETTKCPKIVNVLQREEDNEMLQRNLKVLDRADPDIKIAFEEIEGNFGPDY